MISSFGARFVRRLWTACLVALFIGLAAKSAYACTSAPAMPWFNENVSLLNTNKLNGILIAQDGHTVSLTNNIDTSSFYFNSYNGPKELGKTVQYSSYNNVLLVNNNYVASLEPRNKAEDGRPADIKPPNPKIPQSSYGWIKNLTACISGSVMNLIPITGPANFVHRIVHVKVYLFLI